MVPLARGERGEGGGPRPLSVGPPCHKKTRENPPKFGGGRNPPGKTRSQGSRGGSRAERVAGIFATRAAEHDRDATFPFDNFEDLRAAGFYGLTVPRRYGGQEASLTTFLRVQEELARGDGSTALSFNMHLIRLGGERDSPTYPERWFAEMCRGAIEDGWLANTVATEEGLGSPAGGGVPETTAIETESGWLLNGHKTFVTLAPLLHYCIVMAAIPAPEGRPAVANFMVFPSDPGVRVEPNWDTLGMRATGSHDMLFENVALPARIAS